MYDYEDEESDNDASLQSDSSDEGNDENPDTGKKLKICEKFF